MEKQPDPRRAIAAKTRQEIVSAPVFMQLTSDYTGLYILRAAVYTNGPRDRIRALKHEKGRFSRCLPASSKPPSQLPTRKIAAGCSQAVPITSIIAGDDVSRPTSPQF